MGCNHSWVVCILLALGLVRIEEGYMFRLVVFFILFSVAGEGFGVFLDGEGHYGLLGELRTRPAFTKIGKYQAVRQSFSFLGEARYHDRSSLFLELRLFSDPRSSFLGDHPQPADCPPRYMEDGTPATEEGCEGEHQSITAPGYNKLIPRVSQVFVRYSFDYCLLEAGRRGRDWGLGMFLDSGREPFSVQQSVFDGVTCHVNVQKNQALGFSVGYDKLAETGTYGYAASHFPEQKDTPGGETFGSINNDDDIHQLFFTIEYDNREAADNSGFSRVTGGYFASIFSDNNAVSVKFFDLYLALFYKEFAVHNEFLFRLGRSADPSWHLLGGKTSTASDTATNELNAVALAGNFSWLFHKSGSAVDRMDNRARPRQRHTLLFDYVIAPGDDDGYYRDLTVQEEDDKNVREGFASSNRDTDARAMALHPNFKPALIFYNGISAAQGQKIPGIYDPYQLVNVYLVALGYRYENFVWGDLEFKLITGKLQHGINDKAKEYYRSKDTRPFGYYGRDIGYELDLKYSYTVGQELDLGLAVAMAIPGKAWKTSSEEQEHNFLLQSSVAFKF